MNREELGWKEKKRLLKEVQSNEQLLKEAIHSSAQKRTRFLEKSANVFFSPLSQRIPLFFPRLTKKIQENIITGGMNILSTSYFSIVLFISTLILFLGTMLGVLLFYTYSLWYGFSFGMTLYLTAITVFLIYPFYATWRRRKILEEEAPFIINHCAALITAGVKSKAIFHILNHTPYYPEFTKECKRILNYEQALHLSLSESLNKCAETTPSNRIKIFLQEWAKSIEEKKDTKKFLKGKARSSLEMYKERKNFWTIFKNNWQELKEFFKIYKLNKGNIIAIPLILIGTVFLFQIQDTKDTHFFLSLIGIILLAWLPVLIDTISTCRKYQKQDLQFFLFLKDIGKTRNPLKSERDYNILNPQVTKLKNQIKIGIPLEKAMETFARDTQNPLIKATVHMSIEAKAYGADFYEALYQLGSSKILRKMLKNQ